LKWAEKQNSNMRRYLAVLFVIFLFSCKDEPRGEFGWAATDDRGISQVESMLSFVSEYKIKREGVFFYDYQTIWWIYEIHSGMFEQGSFLAALYEHNNTPEPVEVDLRPVTVVKSGGKTFIPQHYEPLQPGKYVLKIAYKSVIIDQVEFRIYPEGGPSRLQRKSDDERLDEDAESDDELIRNSGRL